MFLFACNKIFCLNLFILYIILFIYFSSLFGISFFYCRFYTYSLSFLLFHFQLRTLICKFISSWHIKLEIIVHQIHSNSQPKSNEWKEMAVQSATSILQTEKSLRSIFCHIRQIVALSSAKIVDYVLWYSHLS